VTNVTRQVFVRPQARRDLLEIAEHIADASPAAAERFLDAFEDSVELIRRIPTIGALSDVRSARLTKLRVVACRRFRKYVILYRVQNDIEVIRVIHGSRDLGGVLDDAL